MNQSKSFSCRSERFPELVGAVRAWLETQNFNCQKLTTEDGGTLIQIEKSGGWRKLIGMSTALNIIFRQVENTVNIEIGAGRWLDKAAAGAVSLVLLWPLALTAGIGAWQQTQMPEKIYQYIADYLSA